MTLQDLYLSALRDRYSESDSFYTSDTHVVYTRKDGTRVEYDRPSGKYKQKSGHKAHSLNIQIPPHLVSHKQDVIRVDEKGDIIDNNWEIDKDTELSDCTLMYTGRGIRCVEELVKYNPGTTVKDWHKIKGYGMITSKIIKKGKTTKRRRAELHWYYSEQTGHILIKRKRWEKSNGRRMRGND